MHCRWEPGTHAGFCYALGASSGQGDTSGFLPSFEVSPRQITLTPSEPAAQVLVRNLSRESTTFAVTDDGKLPDAVVVRTVQPSEPSAEKDGADTLTLEPGEAASFDLDATDGLEGSGAAQGWRARLEIRALSPDADQTDEAPPGPVLDVLVEYAPAPSGRWTGAAYFPDSFGDEGLADWIDDPSDASGVGNALIRHWVAFKNSQVDLPAFLAGLNAVRTASWQRPDIQGMCPSQENPSPSVGCYPAAPSRVNKTAQDGDSGSRVSVYSLSLADEPIPSAVRQVPLVVDLSLVPSEKTSDGISGEGRVVSEYSVGYPGSRKVDLKLGAAETISGGSVRSVPGFSLATWLGWRHRTTQNDTLCSQAQGQSGTQTRVPWLLGQFDTGAGPEGGASDRYECQDNLGQPEPSIAPFGLLSPLPDGRTWSRGLEGIDGALISHGLDHLLFVLFKELVPRLSGAADETATRYGFLILRHADTDVPGGAASETVPVASESDQDDVRQAHSASIACSSELVSQILHDEPRPELGPRNADRVAKAILSGTVPLPDPDRLTLIAPPETPHYLCWATGNFDTVRLPDDETDEEYRPRCPADSAVTFFTLDVSAGDPVPEAECNHVYDRQTGECRSPCVPGKQVDDGACGGPCGDGLFCCRLGEVGQPVEGEPGSCGETLRRWFVDGAYGLRLDPYYEGDPPTPDAYRLRYKNFYQTHEPQWIAEGPEEPHYLCHDTGYVDFEHFDAHGELVPNPPCPAASAVTFFTLAGGVDSRALGCQREPGECHAGEPCASVVASACTTEPGNRCDAKGSCVAAAADFRRTTQYWFRDNVSWQCSSEVTCDQERDNLLAGKVFYGASRAVLFPPLDSSIEQAFRYAVRFPERGQLGLGFAPLPCEPDSNRVPYCYDATEITSVRERVDCAAALYGTYYPELGKTVGGEPSVREDLRAFLERALGTYDDGLTSAASGKRSGFEGQYALLLSVLGDDALARALDARFAATGEAAAHFAGAAFEPQGLDLSGGSGYGFVQLYRSVQYYQLVLDRFYELRDILFADSGIEREAIVTPATASVYYSQLLSASAKKAVAWSAVARRYLWHQRPDLARSVAERAVSAANSEATAIAALLHEQAAAAPKDVRDEIERALRRAQLAHDAAVHSLLFTVARIRSESSEASSVALTIPSGDEVHPFEAQLRAAEGWVTAAVESETLARDDDHAFDNSRVLLTNELAQLNQAYDDRLGEICGTFQGEDGVRYPAATPFASRHPLLQALADPCGMVRSGSLAAAAGRLMDLQQPIDSVRAQRRLWQRAIERLTERASDQCGAGGDAPASWKKWEVTWNQQTRTLADEVKELDTALDAIDWAVRKASRVADLARCDPTKEECPLADGAVSAYESLAIAQDVAWPVSPTQAEQLEQRALSAGLAQTQARWLADCSAAAIDTRAELVQRVRQVFELGLDVWRLQQELAARLAQVSLELEEAHDHAAQYAKNLDLLENGGTESSSPEVRLIQSAARLAADQAFDAALVEIERSTRLFEYYTRQSYAGRESLAARAENSARSLQDYLRGLRASFEALEDTPASSEPRTYRASVRDDVLSIPWVDPLGRSLTQNERANQFQQALRALVTARGGLDIPISTATGALPNSEPEPLVNALDVNIVGTELGTGQARIGVSQPGVALAETRHDTTSPLWVPTQVAFLMPCFNGRATADSPTFETDALWDWPLLSSRWALSLDWDDEQYNKGIAFESLQDLVVSMQVSTHSEGQND